MRNPERRAWAIVMDAIEEAIDVEGLPPLDRGALSAMHDSAAWHVGVAKLRVPVPPGLDGDAMMAAWEIVHGPDGVSQFYRLGVTPSNVYRRLYDAGLLRVADVERATDDELLAIPLIGRTRLRQIRDAVRRYQQGVAR